MIRLLRVLFSGVFALIVGQILCTSVARAQLVNRDWNTGNGFWNVSGNWTPTTSAPDNGTPAGVTYNVQIGNLPVAAGAAVTFVPVSGTSDTIQTLIVSGGADFVTNGNQLITNGLTTITGASSSIRVDPHNVPTTAALQLFDLDVTGGGALQMNGGIATVSTDMDVSSSGVVSGFGTLNVGDTDAVVEKAFQNSGLIQVAGTAAIPGLLTIHANGNGLGVFDTIDLDGDNDIGDINLSNANADLEADTLTLVVDGPLSDALGGGGTSSLLSIGQRDTVTFNKDFTTTANFAVAMDGGNSTATLNGAGAITDIQSTSFSITNKAVITNNMAFTGTANTITLNAGSTLELGGTVTMADASTLIVPSSTSELIISGSTTVTEVTGDFDWDGAGVATTTVKGTGQLTLNVSHVDMTNDLYGGTLNLDDDGDVTVNNVANVWTMAGTIHKRNAGISILDGDAVNVLGGTVTVDAAGTLLMPVTTLSTGSTVTVNGTLSLGGGSVLAGPTSIGGSGTLRLIGASTVTANTTINTTSFDWDGSGANTLHTINDGITFTINSTTWDADDAGDVDDPINIGGGGGTLAVNNVPSWTMTRTLTTNTSASGITSLNGNSRMILSGALAIWNANGQTAVNAPVTFGASSVANIAAAGFIRLNGGDAVSTFNRIEGATINGPGGLLSINTHELRGFGTINAPITFQNASALRADDGTLNIGGAIIEATTIGTADNDGTLNVVNAWNSNVAVNVVLNGGVLQGGAITVANANGIKGKGLVSSRVVNNTRLEANVAAGTLVFETAANDNDWDGAGNIGLLAASNGGTLEVRDNATFTYGGTVTATGGSRVYAKNFGFNFATTSAINLTASTLQTDESSDFNGPINVGAGGDSTIEVQVNRFLTITSTSVVSLGSNLRLVTNNGTIEAGATLSGTGAVIVPAGSHLILEPNANLNTLLVNQGTVRPSGFNTVGREDMRDFQQTDTGRAEFELTGTLLNQIDRFIVNGMAQLDGALTIDIDGGFVPALGNIFNIISATGGVAGTFDTVDVTGMPAGLTFHVTYLPTLVQLRVVNKPFFAADFDDDGDVDLTDFEIWRHAFQLNQLGDATGDGISDARDYVIWRKEFGSHPGAGSAADGLSGANVPEPGTLSLLAVLTMGLGWRRNGRAHRAV